MLPGIDPSKPVQVYRNLNKKGSTTMLHFARTTTPGNMLDKMTETGVLSVEILTDEGWRPSDDRACWYRAAIAALIEAAQSEGLTVLTDHGYGNSVIPDEMVVIPQGDEFG